MPGKLETPPLVKAGDVDLRPRSDCAEGRLPDAALTTQHLRAIDGIENVVESLAIRILHFARAFTELSTQSNVIKFGHVIAGIKSTPICSVFSTVEGCGKFLAEFFCSFKYV